MDQKKKVPTIWCSKKRGKKIDEDVLKDLLKKSIQEGLQSVKTRFHVHYGEGNLFEWRIDCPEDDDPDLGGRESKSPDTLKDLRSFYAKMYEIFKEKGTSMGMGMQFGCWCSKEVYDPATGEFVRGGP